MALDDKIEKISKVSKSVKATSEGIDEVQELARQASNKEHFDALMKAQATQPVTQKIAGLDKNDLSSKSSLMDEVRNLNQQVEKIKVNPKDLVAQADEVINHIESIKQKLATPNLELKPSTQTVLQNKIAHIDENLRVAMSKAGLEYTAAPNADSKLVNPIERFLGFLTNGQQQLNSLSSEIETMHLNNKEISPANMLRIQMKVGYVTQEIEFFTAVLNKALDSTKTIMNVQV